MFTLASPLVMSKWILAGPNTLVTRGTLSQYMVVFYRSAIVSFSFLILWNPYWFYHHSTWWMPRSCFGPRGGFWKPGDHGFQGWWGQLRFLWHVKNHLGRNSNIFCRSFSNAKHWVKSHGWGVCAFLSPQFTTPFSSSVAASFSPPFCYLLPILCHQLHQPLFHCSHLALFRRFCLTLSCHFCPTLSLHFYLALSLQPWTNPYPHVMCQ